jgi:hypothetical protein
LFLCIALVTSVAIGFAHSTAPQLSIVAFPSSEEDALRGAGVTIWTRSGDAIVGSAADDAIAKLGQAGIVPIVQVADTGQSIFLLHHQEGMSAPPNQGATIRALSPTIDLYLYPAGTQIDHPFVKPGGAFMGVPRIPIGPMVPHAADPVTAPSSPSVVNPLVTQIVNGTSQPSWFQYVKDLSGENPTLVGGVMRTINSRYSNSMFPTPASNAYATEYLLEKGAGWGYTGVRESYTAANSGCGGAQPITWQNVVRHFQHRSISGSTSRSSSSRTTIRRRSRPPRARRTRPARTTRSPGLGPHRGDATFQRLRVPQHAEDHLLLRRGAGPVRLEGVRHAAPDRGHVARRQHGPDRVRR